VERIGRDELVTLLRRVFAPRPGDRAVAILVDLPDAELPDTPAWRIRRRLAAGWARELAATEDELGLPTRLVAYRNVRRDNADLPERAWIVAPEELPDHADALDGAAAVPFAEILASHGIVLAPTHLSATAPLKVAARRHGLRAATMPGFTPEMIPALRLDYGEIGRRVDALAALLTRAEAAVVATRAAGSAHRLELDLRHRAGHASGGVFREPGTAGNLPSGEAYIVPYEGEREGDPSRTRGELPLELDGELLLLEIEGNRVVGVHGDGPVAARERAALAAEPAAANVAELGLGVLGELGIEPVGEILLDEKLGLHIAFGRSDHFGGAVGPGAFSRPEAAQVRQF